MWPDEAQFWTFRRMNGRWLLWNVYEFSAWKQFVFGSKAQSVAAVPMESFEAYDSHGKVLTRRKRKFLLPFASIGTFTPLVLACSLIALMTWPPIDSSDFISEIFLIVLPVAVILFVLTYRALSARLQQLGVPRFQYYQTFVYIALLSYQIPVFSVVIANSLGATQNQVAFRAKVINKIERRSKNGIHYFAVLDKPERASCCTAADGDVSWKEELELSIGSHEYRRISPGKTQMEIKVKVGLLGIPYLDSSRLLETETDTSDDSLEDSTP
jgi:hypothetical protein